MAKTVLLQHEQAGVVKKGFYGFSWTALFFGGWVPILRGRFLFGILMLVVTITVSIPTAGIGGLIACLILACLYNKSYTTGMLERGYRFADTPDKVAEASASLGVAQSQVAPPAAHPH